MKEERSNGFHPGPLALMAVLAGLLVPAFIWNAGIGVILAWLGLPFILLLAIKVRERYMVWLGELAPLLKMGHTLPQALTIIGRRPSFSWINTNRLVKDLENGDGFARACGKRMPAMPGLLKRVLEQGEKSGRLPDFIKAYYDYDLKRMALIRSTGDSLSYGFVLFTACFLVFVVLMIFVVPVFEVIYRDAGAVFPRPMEMLAAVSAIVKQYWWLLALILVVVPALLIRLVTGRGVFHGLQQRRDTFLMLLFARAVIETGGQAEEAVIIASRVKGGKLYAAAAEALSRDRHNGLALVDILGREKQLPGDFVSAMVSSVMAGNLEGNLEMFYRAYQEQYGLEAAVGLDRLALAALLFNGLWIAYLLIAIYMSIFNLGAMV